MFPMVYPIYASHLPGRCAEKHSGYRMADSQQRSRYLNLSSPYYPLLIRYPLSPCSLRQLMSTTSSPRADLARGHVLRVGRRRGPLDPCDPHESRRLQRTCRAATLAVTAPPARCARVAGIRHNYRCWLHADRHSEHNPLPVEARSSQRISTISTRAQQGRSCTTRSCTKIDRRSALTM